MVIWDIYLNKVYMYDKMLGPTVDPSGLQGHQVVVSVGQSHG